MANRSGKTPASPHRDAVATEESAPRAGGPPAEARGRTDDERDWSDEADDERPQREAAEARPRAAAGGFFDVYKPSQGRRVRIGSAIVAGVLIFWAAAFLYEKLTAYSLPMWLLYGLPALLLAGGGLGAYHALARSVAMADFLIATEGEMKKVHWTTRKEVIGSTKVVIFVLVFMSVTMFVVDFVLMLFFTEIGVLRIGQDVFSLMFGGS
jgi:preprotein translocase SecE subunit